MSHLLGQSHKRYYCPYCLHSWPSNLKLQIHIAECQTHGTQRTRLPEIGNNVLKFNNIRKQLIGNFTIYADLEALMEELERVANKNQQKKYKHVPSAFAMILVGPNQSVINYKSYLGEDCMDVFIATCHEWSDWASKENQRHRKKIFSADIKAQYRREKTCHICHRDFNNYSKKKFLIMIITQVNIEVPLIRNVIFNIKNKRKF